MLWISLQSFELTIGMIECVCVCVQLSATIAHQHTNISISTP
jgi:hypothetical protein